MSCLRIINVNVWIKKNGSLRIVIKPISSFLRLCNSRTVLSDSENSGVSPFDRISRVTTGVQDELYFFLDFRSPISTISRVDFFSRVASLLHGHLPLFLLLFLSLSFHRLIAIN